MPFWTSRSDGAATVDDSILISQHGAVRRITLNRPERLNAMDQGMQTRFMGAVDHAMADPDTTVVVVAGAGSSFCSGADLKAAARERQGGSGRDVRNAPDDMVRNRRRVAELLALWSSPKPLIAQVHGYCIGIANEIVGACDLVVCAESAKLGMPEVRHLALPPTLGFWPMRLGIGLTKELLFTGRWLSGREAYERGLAVKVVPDADLEATVDELAQHIAIVPVALLSVVKHAVNEWADAGGLRLAALRGADYHAIYHQASEWAAPPERREVHNDEH